MPISCAVEAQPQRADCVPGFDPAGPLPQRAVVPVSGKAAMDRFRLFNPAAIWGSEQASPILFKELLWATSRTRFVEFGGAKYLEITLSW